MNTFFLKSYGGAFLRTGPFRTATTRLRRLLWRVRNCEKYCSTKNTSVTSESRGNDCRGEYPTDTDCEIRWRSIECNIWSLALYKICNEDTKNASNETSCKNFQPYQYIITRFGARFITWTHFITIMSCEIVYTWLKAAKHLLPVSS